MVVAVVAAILVAAPTAAVVEVAATEVAAQEATLAQASESLSRGYRVLIVSLYLHFPACRGFCFPFKACFQRSSLAPF